MNGERFRVRPDGMYFWQVCDGQKEADHSSAFVGSFREESAAQEYANFRNELYASVPKFKIGDRVQRVEDIGFGIKPSTVKYVPTYHYHLADGATVPESELELAPPEPRWVVTSLVANHPGHVWLIDKLNVRDYSYPEETARHLEEWLNADPSRSL